METHSLSADNSPRVRSSRERPRGRRRKGMFLLASLAGAVLYAGHPAPAAACVSDGECDDGLACNGSETCVATSCVPGTPVDCSGADQCMDCTEPTGLCTTPRMDGLGCDDGDRCTANDSCLGGLCQPGAGDDADGDGYCDSEESVLGCSPTDGAEIPPQPSVYSGGNNINRGEILLTYNAPNVSRVFPTDASCAAAGLCDPDTHFCTTGRVADACETDADCNEPAGFCRVVINYADAPDLNLLFATLKLQGQSSIDVLAQFRPVTPGCSRKVDLGVAGVGPFKATFRIKASGTTNGKVRRDRDRIIYREP